MQIFNRERLSRALLNSLAEGPRNMDQLIDDVGAPHWILTEMVEHLVAVGQVSQLDSGSWCLQ